jgi:hypothetical protein
LKDSSLAEQVGLSVSCSPHLFERKGNREAEVVFVHANNRLIIRRGALGVLFEAEHVLPD